MRGDIAAALRNSEAFLRRAEHQDDTGLLMMGERVYGSSLVWRGDVLPGSRHLQRALSLFREPEHDQLAYVFSQHPRTAALSHLCLALQHLGRLDQAMAAGRDAIAQAKRIEHFNSIAYALCFVSLMIMLRRDVETLRRTAGELMQLAQEHNASYWKLWAEGMLGWIMAQEGDVETATARMHQSTAALQRQKDEEQAGARWMDGLFVWRLVRGLEPGALKIGLRRRDRDVPPVELEGWRRSYLDPETGVINGAYQPGEMLQSLCSPWPHDFRDCYCHYWVSDHPDVVYGEIYPGEPTLPTGIAADTERANVRLDWLRADRSRAAAAGALNSFPGNRPYQYDHFQINKTWQDLNVVINDTEIGPLHAPRQIDDATPFTSPEELATELRENLAGLELALICEYL